MPNRQAAARLDARTAEPDFISGTDIPAAPAFIDALAQAAAAPSLKKGERTRRRVLWATAIELARTSFADLNMDQIAQTAAVSRAALYQYVGSKEDAVRAVLSDFNARTLNISVATDRSAGVLDAIRRTNRYYIDYFAKNAVFMERVRELRAVMPEMIAEKQRVNREWAARVIAHVQRVNPTALPAETLKLRVFALECMIDDVLRELFVIENPDIQACAPNLDALAEELSLIWHKVLYQP